MTEWLASGLGLLINHIEQAFDNSSGSRRLGRQGREWTEFDTEALLRSTFKEQIDGLARGVQGGIYAPNEARYKIGLPALPDGVGKIPYQQQQMVPIDWTPPAPVAPAPARIAATG